MVDHQQVPARFTACKPPSRAADDASFTLGPIGASIEAILFISFLDPPISVLEIHGLTNSM